MGSCLLGRVKGGYNRSLIHANVEVEHPYDAPSWLRFKGAAKGWDATAMDKLQPEQLPPLNEIQPIGLGRVPEEPIFENAMPEGWTLMQHGLVKGTLLLLGVSHHHDGDDIMATCGWESMVNALGYTVRNGNLHQNVDLNGIKYRNIYINWISSWWFWFRKSWKKESTNRILFWF